jgi:hypothetical protein
MDPRGCADRMMGNEAAIFLRDKRRLPFLRRKKNHELASALLASFSAQKRVALADDFLEEGREFHASPALKSQVSRISGKSFSVP